MKRDRRHRDADSRGTTGAPQRAAWVGVPCLAIGIAAGFTWGHTHAEQGRSSPAASPAARHERARRPARLAIAEMKGKGNGSIQNRVGGSSWPRSDGLREMGSSGKVSRLVWRGDEGIIPYATHAIYFLESRCGADPRAARGIVGPAGERGGFQTTPIFWADCRRLYHQLDQRAGRGAGIGVHLSTHYSGRDPAHEVGAYDDTLCRLLIALWLEHYADDESLRQHPPSAEPSRQSGDLDNDSEELLRLYNAGPRGARLGRGKKYIERYHENKAEIDRRWDLMQ